MNPNATNDKDTAGPQGPGKRPDRPKEADTATDVRLDGAPPIGDTASRTVAPAGPSSPPGQSAPAGQSALSGQSALGLQKASAPDLPAAIDFKGIERYMTPQGDEFAQIAPQYHHLTITVSKLRANSKMFLNMREDQWAMWAAGNSRGMRGVAIEATKDPVLYLSNFLVNAREMYLQTYADSTEMQIFLYVHTPQTNLRGRVDLPPGASVTLESRCDRSSLIGLSSFSIEF